MRARMRTAAARAAVFAGLGACGGGATSRPSTPAEAPRLARVWDATFVLDAPPLGFDSAALRATPQGRVHGILAVVPNHWLTTAATAAATLPTRPTLYGAYDVDFTPFGFDPRDADRVPDVVGTASSVAPPGRDSVLLVLGPASERGRVVLAGTLRADSIVGTWQLQSAGRAGTTAQGHFVLVASPATPSRPAAAAATFRARARAVLHGGEHVAPGGGR